VRQQVVVRLGFFVFLEKWWSVFVHVGERFEAAGWTHIGQLIQNGWRVSVIEVEN
jgi:hypothetical protein